MKYILYAKKLTTKMKMKDKNKIRKYNCIGIGIVDFP